MKNIQIIYIYGPDGSGKSTICKELMKVLNEKGIRATYRWMRFNHYFSKVVNAVGHITGLSFYKVYPDGTRVGYHQYYKSSFLSFIYCISTILDTIIASVFKLWLPLLVSKKTIIVDRFIFDTMVDLSIDTHNANLVLNWQGRLLKSLLPSNSIHFFLDVSRNVILKRRPDIKWDENFNLKVELYKKVFELYGKSRKVNNNGEIDSTIQTIIENLVG